MTTPARSRSTSALAIAACVACLGCPGAEPAAPAKAAPARPAAAVQQSGPAKPGAVPVGLSCALSDRTATLTLTANGRVTGASVKAWGTRGLEVTGVSGAPSADWAPGETATVTVRYDAAPPGARLAVSVEGEVGGRRRSRVVSFAVGTEVSNAKPTTVDPSTGRTLRVLPAK